MSPNDIIPYEEKLNEALIRLGWICNYHNILNKEGQHLFCLSYVSEEFIKEIIAIAQDMKYYDYLVERDSTYYQD